MIKIVAFVGMALGMLVLSGCSAPAGFKGTGGTPVAVLKSTDGGAAYEPKDKVSQQQVVGAEVLALLIDRSDARRIYIGTRTDGIYTSEDAGETWKKMTYPPTKVYGLAADASDARILYATGEWQSRGKVYRSEDSGATWKEIYTEPATGTVITSLAASPARSGEVIIGLSNGVLVRTQDGGKTWNNIPALSAAVTTLAYDPHHADQIYALVLGKGLWRSVDRGGNFAELSVRERVTPTKIVTEQDTVSKKKLKKTQPVINPNQVDQVSESVTTTAQNVLGTGVSPVSLAFDPRVSGVVYVGTDKSGIWRSVDGGENWEALNILASSREHPIRAVAVNPFNSDEVLYSGAFAVYRSVNRGVDWSTYQLNTASVVGSIVYDVSNAGVIYLGFRSF